MYEDFWASPESDEFAQTGRRGADRRADRHASMLAFGCNVCFGGKGGGSSAADPQIGQAALMQAQTGDDWLNFARQQFDIGNERQNVTDALSTKVTQQQLASQDRANDWAQQDRDISQGLQTKYEGWGDEDRALGRSVYDQMQGAANTSLAHGQTYADRQNYYGDRALNEGTAYAQKFSQLADQARATGDSYGTQFDQRAGNQYDFADTQQKRYTDTFQPVEDKLVSDSMSWDSDARLSSEAAKAKADVVGNAQQQREASQRSMASMGVDPRSGRYAGVERATDLNTALAAAGAQNSARDNIRSQAQELRTNAASLGQNVISNSRAAETLGQQASNSAANARFTGQQLGLSADQAGNSAQMAGINTGMQAGQAAHTALLSGQSASLQAANLGLSAAGVGNNSAQLGLSNQGAGYSGLSTGLNAGNSALGANTSANQSWNANNAVMGQGFSGAMQGYAGQASTLNQSWSNQIAQQNASNASAGGLMSGIGSIAGAGIMAF